jgi:hypothetical protein
MPRFEDHPLGRLTVKDGKIQLIGSTASAEYLGTPEVRVIAKESLHESDGSTDVSYVFRLNCHPDFTWTDIFQNVRETDGVVVDRDYLHLRCIPANLQGRYRTVKDVISQTNRLYAEHEALLTEKVIQLNVQREQRAKAQSARTAAVNEQFADLEV